MLTRIINQIGKNQIFWFSVIIVKTVIIITGFEVKFTSDTISYYYPFRIFEGHPHPFRMVIYPEFIHLLSSINKEASGFYAVVIQHLLSFLSLFCFYKSLRELVAFKPLIHLTVLLYAVWPTIYNYDNYVLTESFSVLLMNYYVYYFLKSIKCGYKDYYLKIVGTSILALMLKPIFIFLIILTSLYLIYILYIHKFRLISVYASIAFMWFIILGYCGLNYRKNNYYGLSTISINNQLANIIMNGSYVNGKDSELIDVINKSLYEKKSVYQIVFTLNTMTKPQDYLHYYPSFLLPTVNNVISENGNGYSMERLTKFIKKSNLSLIHFENILYRAKTFLLAYKKIAIMSLLSFIMIFIKYLKTKKIPLMISFMLFGIWLNIASIILFSINEWERLLLPSIPLIILLYVYFLDLSIRYVGYEFILIQFKKFKDHVINTIN